MKKLNKNEGFRPDDEVKKILEIIQTKGFTKTDFILNAIKFYYKSKFVDEERVSVNELDIEKKLDEIKLTLIKELRGIKEDISRKPVLEVENKGESKEMTAEERDDLILNIGNAFVAWGEPAKELKNNQTNNKTGDFVDEDEIEI